jgi:hypothetical protein
MKWALCVVLIAPLWAQDAYIETWGAARQANPAGLAFTVALAKTTFYIGETVPLQMKLDATGRGNYSALNRSPDRGLEEYVVDLADIVEDPLVTAVDLSGIVSEIPLQAKPFEWERNMNDRVRFRRPGTYRFYVRTLRVRQPVPGDAAPGMLRRTALPTVSNVLTIEVLPAPADWVAQRTAAAAEIVKTPRPIDTAGSKRWSDALLTLQYLDTREAGLILVRMLDGNLDTPEMHMRVALSPVGKDLLPVMERQLVAPEWPVSPAYLSTLSELALTVELGRPAPPDLEALRTRLPLLNARREVYVRRLIAALPAKQPEARVASFQTLLEETFRTKAIPAWAPLIVGDVVKDFRTLPSSIQSSTLTVRWDMLKIPAMIPVLRDLAQAPAQPRDRINDIALRRLIDIAPQAGRALVIPQLVQRTKDLTWETLAALTDASLPELDQVFAADYEAGGRIEERVIARYASGAIVGRLERVVERRLGGLGCRSGMLPYFLKYDPAFGEARLRRSIADCGTLNVPVDMHSSMMSPTLERVAIEHLMKDTLQVKRESAEVLGKYGSAAAFPAVWSAMKTFHSWWKGRGEELDKNFESRDQEVALAKALTQSKAWKLTRVQMNELAAMCTSTNCKRLVEAEVNAR